MKKVQRRNMRDENERMMHLCRKQLPFIYVGILFIMLGMIISNEVLKNKATTFFGLGSYERITQQWKDVSNDTFDFDNIKEYADSNSDYISTYFQLPDQLDENQTLVFRSKNAMTEVYIDGESVYKTDMVEAPFYNKSPGTRWNLVLISEEDAGKTIELQVKFAYKDGLCKVDNFYLGDRTAIVLQIIETKGFAIILCVFIFFTGLLYFAIAFILNAGQKVKDLSLFYLAFFSVFAAVWCLLETNVVQLFAENQQQIQVIVDCLLMIGAIPIFLYMDCAYGIFKVKFIRILFIINLIYVFLSTMSQCMGGLDLHQMLNGSIATYGFIIIILITCIIRQQFVYHTVRRKTPYDFLQLTGVCFLGLAITIDWARFLVSDVMDRAFITRIGLLIFVLCFGIGNSLRLHQLVARGMQNEIAGKLAYMDGLTEAGNRTAYMEHINELIRSKEKEKVVIMMFDVNDLKQINDTFGHHAGDELIKAIACIIQKNFGRYGQIYRIGGDEFIMLVKGQEFPKKYQKLKYDFLREVEKCNESKRYPFQVGAAFGIAYCDSMTRDGIRRAERFADEKMYDMKREMKRHKICENSISF